MKIEGMQYPLPANRIVSRGSESTESPSGSDDAVYFEPDEKRREKQRQQQDQQPARQELAAEIELTKPNEPASEANLETLPLVPKSDKAPATRIVDVLA